MIDAPKRQTIWQLYQDGVNKKKIAHLLNVDLKTVRRVVEQKGELPQKSREDKKHVDQQLLESVYHRCNRWGERTREVLDEEYGIKIGYSTLMRLIRDLEIDEVKNKRSGRVPDEPGEEFQHDTSPYVLKLGSQSTHLQCSGLYYRYCKMRYVKFYRVFNRFTMKSFFYEALNHFRYSAKICVIDNTNLAVLRGSGKNAVFVPEMINFAKRFDFEWLAHEIKHSDRKAGTERNFRSLNQNFFPGRSFSSLEDLNRQVFKWATERYARRPQSKTKLIPIELFEIEKPYLQKLPSKVEPPYRVFDRLSDQYGFVALHANFYWVPGKSKHVLHKVIEYPDRMEVYHNRQLLIKYPLPAEDVKKKAFKPEEVQDGPWRPKSGKIKSADEEKKLRSQSELICQYIDFIKSKKSGIRLQHKFIRNLYQLSCQLSPSLFKKTIDRALTYGIGNISTLERISVQFIRTTSGHQLSELNMSSSDYQKRDTYLEGRFSDEPDLNQLKDLLESEDE
jgi:transposase